MESFGVIAPFYDELMRGVPYAMWASYYQLLLAQQDVKPKQLLDLACGTGTIAELLTLEGYQVTGVDISAPMIEVARQKALRKGHTIAYHVANAVDFDLGERFEGAYSFFDSLNYVTTYEGFEKALERVAAHLSPGGSWVFDLNTAYAFEARLFDQQELRAKERVRYRWIGEYDSATRLICVEMEFWKGGERFSEKHIQRAHSDEEVCHALNLAGFGDVQCFESYSLDRPRPKSDRVHYTAIRL